MRPDVPVHLFNINVSYTTFFLELIFGEIFFFLDLSSNTGL